MKDRFSIFRFTSKGNVDKNIKELESMLSEKQDPAIYNNIGDLYLKKGDEKMAIESFTKAAEIYKKEGFYPKAIAVYKKILNIRPDHVESLIALGGLYAERGLTGNAIDYLFRAAEIYKRENANERAITIVDKILQISPDDPEIKIRIGDLYMRLGIPERAANEFSLAADIYLKKGDSERARELFKKAITLDPSNVSALIIMSEILKNEGNIQEAVEYMKKAVSARPDDPEMVSKYAMLMKDSGDREEARRILTEFVKRSPSEPIARKLLGEMLLEDGKTEEAWEHIIEYVDRAIEEGMDMHEGARLLEGFRKTHPEPVLERLIKIYRLNSDDINLLRALKELAGIYRKKGKNQEALSLLREAYDIFPDDQEVIKEMSALETLLGISKPHEEEGKKEEQVFKIDDLLTQEILDQEPVDEIGESGVVELDLDSEPSDMFSTDPDTFTMDSFSEKKAEADFYAQQGLIDEAIKIYEKLVSLFPTNEELKRNLENLRASASKKRDSLDISIEKVSKDELQEQDRLELSTSGADKKEKYKEAFEKGMEYRNSGLLDMAIKSFQDASIDPDLRIRALRMIAECYMEKGLFSLAIKEYEKILEVIERDDPYYIEIKYELGNAQMMNEEYKEALETFNQIKEIDPGFRDISDKIKTVEQKLSGPVRQGKRRDRVSYI